MLLASIHRGLGDLSRAAGMLAEAELRIQRDLPAGHYGFASVMSERALQLQAHADLHGALDNADRAITLVEKTVKEGGEGSFYLPVFLVRRSDLELRLGRSGDASADAERAVAMLEQTVQPGTFSCDLGRAWLVRGRAYQANGRHEEARAALTSAVNHLQNSLGPDHPDTRTAQLLLSNQGSAPR